LWPATAIPVMYINCEESEGGGEVGPCGEAILSKGVTKRSVLLTRKRKMAKKLLHNSIICVLIGLIDGGVAVLVLMLVEVFKAERR